MPIPSKISDVLLPHAPAFARLGTHAEGCFADDPNVTFFDEQVEISRELARALDTIESLRQSIETKAKKFDTLTQSILAEAFRGELVPQDPSDEPTSLLLERIRAERATAGVDKPRRTRRKAAPC